MLDIGEENQTLKGFGLFWETIYSDNDANT